MTAVILTCLALGPVTGARANSDADKVAITNRLNDWTRAFNARDSAEVSDLFSPDLISTVQDAQDAGRDAVCSRLTGMLARTDLQLSYSPDIQEIIVSGDLAAVRMIWTLKTRHGSELQTSREAGLDIFQRQSDGSWSIIRYMTLFLATPAR